MQKNKLNNTFYYDTQNYPVNKPTKCLHEQMVENDIKSGLTKQQAESRQQYIVCKCDKCTKNKPTL
jgi:hypothetical protein